MLGSGLIRQSVSRAPVFRRFLTTANNKNVAFAFDIDGVLIKGSKTIPQAQEALQLLNNEKVPWVLVTNGGGKTERERVQDLSQRLGGIDIPEDQFMQSHTPFKRLVDLYKGKVLIVGGDGDDCRKVAKLYGFKNPVIGADIIRKHPSIWPFHRYRREEIEQWADPSINVDDGEPFDAILVFNDPRDMGTEIQIILDLLLSENGVLGTRRKTHTSRPSIPIHFSNKDLLWSNDYPIARFGQGAFKATIDTLYETTTEGYKLESVVIGKPFKETYDYAHNLLVKKFKENQNISSISAKISAPTVYMVGDNPASDILGANGYGWRSVLVRTGVYQDGADLQGAKPTVILDNVLDAVKYGLEN
ncbi:hypothetical protein AWJ20_3463 [Sugiyamaella lignohabitans]|uniref:Uncharacterized protein n=1 Tax=Sugiyamaella lignohabitans TaxID=796027 RepID=A0A167FX98_9ASCO|nr:uncharacterized protein AWJ20_3463 [Sugiyamaella lignohabitans]ANB15819.1 hypothetical protein AWJ20_3463 [Sugiyamaella lignohabitans]